MPNPAIHPQAGGQADQPQPGANGILSWIGGDLISGAAGQLPRPGPTLAGEVRTVDLLGVDRFGAVRITFEMNSYQHGRSRHWHWRAVRADSLMLALQVRPARFLDDFYWQPR